MTTSTRHIPRILSRAVILAGSFCLAAGQALACTGIILRAEDGAIVPARTLEFSFDIQSNIYAVPAGTEIETLALDADESGFTFTAKYGFLGANAFEFPVVFDGINTEGLYFGAFYFATEAVFGEVSDDNRDRAVSSDELGNWVLGQFTTVEEVRAALPKIEVVGTYVDVIDGFAPFHYLVADASGAAIVIEYTAAGLTIHDNPVNAITNDPTFDWHLTNLSNYIGLQAENRETITVGDLTLATFGQGSGMIGLPGDFSSPARFVRAVAFANTALPSATGDEAVFQAFHILNAFDIPKGAVRETGATEMHTDYTVWSSASDTASRSYYFKTYKTQAIEKIDVRAALDGLHAPAVLTMESGFVVRDRTKDFR
ncbi:choloylglycine hydrolase family protein [Thioalkalivibrio sp. XN8]|uniref:linear amide C-N hydrolase n=1 Tax=Thioalkalivibrio sp. XN8 TaxID=2712863 RepID=UPI0013EAD573|nr:choloylglycine hydrolase family protein [Thioalkalivibrio sp. XN8]NGP53131.1 choloylglycine hydrolase family protein [Thioalkalivibrio sp. XN8]